MTEETKCPLLPAGWSCSLPAGHGGPCLTSPDSPADRMREYLDRNREVVRLDPWKLDDPVTTVLFTRDIRLLLDEVDRLRTELGICNVRHDAVRQVASNTIDENTDLVIENRRLREILQPWSGRSTSEFLNWVADRLVFVHGEHPDVDFVLALRRKARESQSLCRRCQRSPSTPGNLCDGCEIDLQETEAALTTKETP